MYRNAPIQLDLAGLLEALGVQGQAFAPQFAAVRGDGGPNSVSRTEFGGPGGSSPYYEVAANGREIYMPIGVNVGHDVKPGTSSTYAELLGVKDSAGAITGRWSLPCPVFSTEQVIHVIDTALTERSGWVSERINLPGFKLQVRGHLINFKEDGFAEDDYATLMRLVYLGIPFRIDNPVTDWLFSLTDGGEDKLVTIRNFKLEDTVGVRNVRGYSMELVQEVPFNLVDIS